LSKQLIEFLLKLAPRERRLLAVLFVLVLPVGLVVGVLVPLHQAQSEALTARSDAIALNIWVQERHDELKGLKRAPDFQPRAAIGTSGIEASLIDAGLRDDIRELSVDGLGTVQMRFETVRFVALMTWLSATNTTWGYDIAQFRLEPSPVSGMVTASFTLVPQEAKGQP